MEQAEFSKALMEGVMSLVDCHQQSLALADCTKCVLIYSASISLTFNPVVSLLQ